MRLFRGAIFFLIILGIWFDWTLWRITLEAQTWQLPQEPAEAIIVLGCGAGSDGRASYCQIARVNAAVQLWQSGYAPYLIMTGGAARDTTEAKMMADLAIAQGVPSEQIFQETRARSTVENMRFSKKILAEHNLKKVIIVTEPYHMYRAREMARDQSIEVVGWRPAVESRHWIRQLDRYFYLILDTRSLMVYEVAGWLVYNEDLGFSP